VSCRRLARAGLGRGCERKLVQEESDEWHNHRPSDGSSRSSLFGLLERVPAVVIDARVTTESDVGETPRVLSRRLVQKALFVTNDDGLAPALAAAGVRVQASSVLSEADVADMLKRSRLRHAISPDDDALLGRLGRR
jgi:hypothetical protein